MAREYTPEDIARAQAAVDDQVRKFGYAVRDLEDALADAKVGVRGYSAGLRQSAQDIQRAFTTPLTEMLTKPKAGIGNLTDALDLAEKATKGYGKSVKGLAGPLAQVGGMLLNLTSAGGKQLDVLSKTYSSLNRFGIGLNSFDDAFDMLRSFNLPVAEEGIQKLQQLITENADFFLFMGKSASDGARNLSQFAREVHSSPLLYEFRQLGLTTEEINKYIGNFSKIMLRSGIGIDKDFTKAGEALRAFIKETETISRTLGITREQQEKSILEAQSYQRFRAMQEEARINGDTKTVKSLNNFASQVNALPKEFHAGMYDIIAAEGGITSEAAAHVMRTFGPEFVEGLRDVIQEKLSFPELLQQTARGEGRERLESMTGVARYADISQTMGYVALADLIKKYNDIAEGEKQSRAEVTTRMFKTQGDMVDTFAKLSVVQDNMRKSMEDLAKAMAPKETQIDQLTNAINALTKLMSQEKYTVQREPGRPPAAGGPKIGKASVATPKQTLFGTEGEVKPALVSLIERISEEYPGITLTSLNDDYHRNLNYKTKHVTGEAVDFTFPEYVGKLISNNRELGEQIAETIKSLGAGLVTDEYNSKSPAWTGPHFHAELKNGGITQGPSLAGEGGPEAVVPLPDGRTIPVEVTGMNDLLSRQVDLLTAQVDKLDGLANKLDTLNDTSRRIMQYSQ